MASDVLNDILNKKFKSEEGLKRAISSNEIYKFSELSIVQLLKVFEVEVDSSIFCSNSKKHLNKVYDLMVSELTSPISTSYLKRFFFPSFDVKDFEDRKIAVLGLLDIGDDIDLSEEISKLEFLSGKITLLESFYTLEPEIEEKFYAKYKIKIQVLSKEEFQTNYTSFDEDSVFITEEDLMIDFPTYKPEEFEKILIGNLIKNNKERIENLIDIFEKTSEIYEGVCDFGRKLKTELEIDLNSVKLRSALNEMRGDELKTLSSRVINLDEEIKKLNVELKEKISKYSVNLEGDELVQMLNSGNLQKIQDKLKEETFDYIKTRETELISSFKSSGLKINFLFANSAYPIEMDEEIHKDLLKQIEIREKEIEYEEFEKLSEFSISEIKKLYNYSFFCDLALGIRRFILKYDLNYCSISDSDVLMLSGKNMYVKNATPIDYGLSTSRVGKWDLRLEKISVLTGANSGGKTTLLEMFLQGQILSSLGFPMNCSSESKFRFYDEVVYLKKFTGTQGSGAFEQTIRNLIEILDSSTSKLLLIDEFEAVTEPGAAAKILINFLLELDKKDVNVIAVSHLGLEISEVLKEMEVESIRIDGISATGLDEKGNLVTTHQPQFYELGKSTPELILKRILQDEKFWVGKSPSAREILEKIV